MNLRARLPRVTISAVFKMTQRDIKKSNNSIQTTETYIGESIETKVRRTMESNAPIEAISPMVYTERKDGVKPETNIRTDKWDIAQTAMDTIAQGMRQKRNERMNAKTDTATATKSEMNVQA